MSTATITRLTPDLRRISPEVRRPARSRVARGPVARPTRTLPAPAVSAGQRAEVHSCQLGTAAAGGQWRLTDRGVAVVLVLVAMIAVAAVAVIGLTAWQVTGADYATGSAVAVKAQ